MNRRQFFLTASTTPALACHSVSGSGSQQDALAHVAEAAHACVAIADDCLRHCHQRLSSGDTTMAECHGTVLNMIAVCTAMTKLATYRTASMAHAKSLAAACRELCLECANACKVHAGHHAECKACMQHCEKCAEACQALMRA